MRKVAYLARPLRRDAGNCIYKIMLYGIPEGYYLFEYDSPDAVQCSSDRFYDSPEDFRDDWDHLIDERGWMDIDDPLPDCQHDAWIPLRVKGRNTGNPEWGKLETLQGGKWVEYIPDR